MNGDQHPVRVGIIGLGLIAQVAHLPALKALRGEVEVSHLCDVSEGLAATIAADGWPAAKVTTDWTELVSADLDAVVVCTPGSHGRIAEAFLAAGKHVLAEKPLCLSRAACQQLMDVAAANSSVLQVGYMKVHEPMVQAANEACSTIGSLRHVRITVVHPADDPQVSHLTLHRGDATDQDEIARSRAYEDAEVVDAIGHPPESLRNLYTDLLHGSIIHQIALLRGLVGATPTSWSSVLASPFSVADGGTEPPSIQATTQLDDGLTVSLSWNWAPGYPTYREEAEIIGADGSIHLTLSPPYAYEPPRLTVVTGSEGEQHTSVVAAGHVDGFRHQMRAFIDAINSGGQVRANGGDALDDVISLQSMLATIASGVGVRLGGEAMA